MGDLCVNEDDDKTGRQFQSADPTISLCGGGGRLPLELLKNYIGIIFKPFYGHFSTLRGGGRKGIKMCVRSIIFRRYYYSEY